MLQNRSKKNTREVSKTPYKHRVFSMGGTVPRQIKTDVMQAFRLKMPIYENILYIFRLFILAFLWKLVKLFAAKIYEDHWVRPQTTRRLKAQVKAHSE